MKHSKEKLLIMYKQMVLSRVYDTMLQECCMNGSIIGMHHLALGQEAIGAGIIGAIKETDWLTPTHRMHATQLYRCDLKLFAAEQFGKVTGSNQGMACDYHMSVPENRLLFGNGILGQNIPMSAGFAYALKLAGKGDIVVACEGDGAFTEGINYETMYMAATFGLPLVMIVEDNKFAISYSSDVNKTTYADRARAFGLSAVTVDGNDVVAVCEAVEAAAEKARKNETSMVECKTVRWSGHHTGDSQWWRNQEELAAAKKDDPIVRFEKQLYDLKHLTVDEREQIWKKTEADVEEAKQFALEGAFPDESVLLDYGKVYVNPWEVTK